MRSESDAWQALVAARRLHDEGGVTKREAGPLAMAAAQWLREAGIEDAIGLDAVHDLNELLRAVQALSEASTAPPTRTRSPAQAHAMQAKAWERIQEIAARRGWA